MPEAISTEQELRDSLKRIVAFTVHEPDEARFKQDPMTEVNRCVQPIGDFISSRVAAVVDGL